MSDTLNEIKKLLKSYNGNANLKRAGEKIEFTQENVLEWIKCKDDPIYFINKYCKIISLDEGLVEFKTFKYQDRTIEAMHSHRNNIIMFPRQMGKTTVVAAYILHYVLFSDIVPKVAIVAHKASGAREVMARLQLMYEYIPKWMQRGVKTWNKGNIILEGDDGADGAEVFTGATTGSGLRGRSVSLLYIDECAIIPNTIAEEFFTSTYPTISSGEKTKIIMSSTPKGYNHFWKFWSDAESKEHWNGFNPVRAKWDEHPKRDRKWLDDQLKLLGQLKLTQEVLCEFLGSSATLVTSECLSGMVQKPFIYEKDGLSIQERPVLGHTYAITVDTSKGVGGDCTTFSIIDITCLPYVVVGKYKNNLISPMLFPTILYKVASEYNQAFILIEVNVSEQIPHILYYDLEYENLLTVVRGPKGQTITGGFMKAQLGVQMDKRVKSVGCSNLKILLEEKKLLVHDPDIIGEISTFIDNNKGSYAADDGYRDDLVMTLVMFGWLTTQEYFKDVNSMDLRVKIYEDRMRAIDNEMLPIGFLCDGLDADDVELLDFMK